MLCEEPCECAVSKHPVMARKEEISQDLALSVGATFVSRQMGKKLKEVKLRTLVKQSDLKLEKLDYYPWRQRNLESVEDQIEKLKVLCKTQKVTSAINPRAHYSPSIRYFSYSSGAVLVKSK